MTADGPEGAMFLQVEDTEGQRHLINLALVERISLHSDGDAEIEFSHDTITIDRQEYDRIERLAVKHNQDLHGRAG